MSELESRALPIPPDLAEQPVNDFMQELIRAWWDGERARTIVRPAFSDPRQVGTLLAELSHHFANGYAVQNGLDRHEVLKDIRARWDEVHNTGMMKELLVTEPMEGKK